MGRISQTFFPPRYWQEFEDLTQAVFSYVFGDQSPHKFGRPGQAQNGVDVYGESGRYGGIVGIQCKRMDELDENNNPFPGGTISDRLLREEYRKAILFRPRLTRWIFATTAKRDAGIQSAVADLSEESKCSGHFSVGIWFWDDYVSFLNTYDDLVRHYYSHVLQLRTSKDEDREILDFFATAFSRAAFHTSLQREHADHWFTALKDTQRALSTGELVDRETRHVIRKVVGGWRQVHDEQLRKKCGEVYRALRNFRTETDHAIESGALGQRGDGNLVVQDHKVASQLLGLRDECIRLMNKVLLDAGLPGI